MDTFGVDFDKVAAKPLIDIRNAARDNYVPAFEKTMSYVREKLEKDMTAREALESMRSNLDALCSSIHYVCQKMEEPIPAVNKSIFDILLYEEETDEEAKAVREKILKEGGERLSPASGAAENLKLLFDNAVIRTQDMIRFWTARVNEVEAAITFWRRSAEMITWRTIFDCCDEKFKVKVSREAVREYAAYIELAKSYLQMMPNSPSVAMKDDEFIAGAKDMLAVAECNFKYLRSFKNVASDYGHEVALNAHEAAQVDERERIKCGQQITRLGGSNHEIHDCERVHDAKNCVAADGNHAHNCRAGMHDDV